MPTPDRSAVRCRATVTASAADVKWPAVESGTSIEPLLPNSDRARATTDSTSAQVCMSDIHQLCDVPDLLAAEGEGSGELKWPGNRGHVSISVGPLGLLIVSVWPARANVQSRMVSTWPRASRSPSSG